MMLNVPEKKERKVTTFSVSIDAIEWNEALAEIVCWAKKRQSRYVCLCNVHSLVTAQSNIAHKRVLRDADMVVPDGMPIAWALRRLGATSQERLGGPDLMWKLCESSAEEALRIFIYGGTKETSDLLVNKLKLAFPRLAIVGTHSPPFRKLSAEEDREIVKMINQSAANILFVGLGCPKQEDWMAFHRGRIQSVMLGVGAAFSYHAGTLKRAPRWMQAAGLEWFHRLCTEPRRMWRRYLVTNTYFLFLVLKELASRRLTK